MCIYADITRAYSAGILTCVCVYRGEPRQARAARINRNVHTRSHNALSLSHSLASAQIGTQIIMRMIFRGTVALMDLPGFCWRSVYLRTSFINQSEFIIQPRRGTPDL